MQNSFADLGITCFSRVSINPTAQRHKAEKPNSTTKNAKRALLTALAAMPIAGRENRLELGDRPNCSGHDRCVGTSNEDSGLLSPAKGKLIPLTATAGEQKCRI
jgi:hypothetical protein